jgi:hypothetical protein
MALALPGLFKSRRIGRIQGRRIAIPAAARQPLPGKTLPWFILLSLCKGDGLRRDSEPAAAKVDGVAVAGSPRSVASMRPRWPALTTTSPLTASAIWQVTLSPYCKFPASHGWVMGISSCSRQPMIRSVSGKWIW